MTWKLPGVTGGVGCRQCCPAAQEQMCVLSLSADGAVSQPKALHGQSKGFDLCVQRS